MQTTIGTGEAASAKEAACCRTQILEKLSMLQEPGREKPPAVQEQGAGEPTRPAQAWGEKHTYFSYVPPAPPTGRAQHRAIWLKGNTYSSPTHHPWGLIT